MTVSLCILYVMLLVLFSDVLATVSICYILWRQTSARSPLPWAASLW
jgi:hypothetical protein